MEMVLNYLKDLLMRIPLISQNGYLGDQWDKYYSVTGFIMGLIFLILLYSANKDKKDHPIKGMIQVLMMVAVINGCSVFWEMVCEANPDARWYPVWAGLLFQPENLFSGCLLTLALHTTYRGKTWAGAAFGLVTRLALVLMNYNILGGMGAYGEMETIVVLILAQAVSAFFLSAVIAKRKTFTASWVWYLVYQVLPILVMFIFYVIGSGVNYYGGDLLLAMEAAWDELYWSLPDLMPYGMISAAVLLVSILLDVSVRTISGKRT